MIMLKITLTILMKAGLTKIKSASRFKGSENQFPLMSLTQVSPPLSIFYLNMYILKWAWKSFKDKTASCNAATSILACMVTADIWDNAFIDGHKLSKLSRQK